MTTFRVSYYKILLSSDGHPFKCLQRAVEVDAATPIAALTSIEARGLSLAGCDCLEVTSLVNINAAAAA